VLSAFSVENSAFLEESKVKELRPLIQKAVMAASAMIPEMAAGEARAVWPV
jgi:hypothetical protein